MTTDDLAARIRALEDAEKIRNLKAIYATYCDDNYDADKIAELFVEDAIWESDAFGVLRGREEIRNFFRNVSKVLTFSVHFYANPHIEVNGDEARGRWLLLQPCVATGDRALWRAGIDEEVYVRVDGEWKFKHKTGTNIFTSTFEEGWARSRHVPVT